MRAHWMPQQMRTFKCTSPTKKSIITRIRALHPARRSEHDSESGAVLVEFALILPLVLILLLLILDFGRAINYWVDTTHLASEGARLAAVDKVCPDTRRCAGTPFRSTSRAAPTPKSCGPAGRPGVSSPGLEVCVEYPEDRDGESPVTVTVSAEYDWMPVPGQRVRPRQTTTIKGRPRTGSSDDGRQGRRGV